VSVTVRFLVVCVACSFCLRNYFVGCVEYVFFAVVEVTHRPFYDIVAGGDGELPVSRIEDNPFAEGHEVLSVFVQDAHDMVPTVLVVVPRIYCISFLPYFQSSILQA